MNDEDLSAALEDAGLSPYQAEAYVALLELGTASATDVADASDVPDPRIYDVLRDLEAKGYVETFEQQRLTARARDPDEVIAELQSRSERFLDAAAAIEDRWTSPAVGDHELTVVKRLDTVFARARELIAGAEVQVAAALSLEQFRAVDGTLADARDRGVLVFLTVWTDDATTPDPAAEEFAGRATAVRARSAPAPFLAVVDRTNTCFSSWRDDPSTYGLLVDDAAHTGVFWWFFTYCLWRGADPVFAEQVEGASGPFLDVPECTRSIGSRLAAGETVTVSVTGFRADSKEPIRLTGTVLGPCRGGTPVDPDGPDRSPDDPGVPGLLVETDDGETRAVGGWGPVLEDVEATCITVTDVSRE